MPVIQRTAQAEEDLIDIWIHVAQDNPAAEKCDQDVVAAR